MSPAQASRSAFTSLLNRQGEQLRSRAEREPGEDDDDPTPAIDLAKLASIEVGSVGRSTSDDDRADVAQPEDRGIPDDATGSEPPRENKSGAHVICMANVAPKSVEWLWSGRIPAGMVAILDGPPGAGKSTVVIDLVARLTTGRPFPDEIGTRPVADVVLLGQEDSPEHTIRPRLDAAGADPRRVHLLADIGGRMPRLPEDGQSIERAVRDTRARLLVIDPVSAYIGADLHRDNEVRGALAPLALIAERTGATVLLLRHLRKSGGTEAMSRGLGSVGIIALARAGLMLLTDPDDPKARILTWSKMSVAHLPRSLRWRFGEATAEAPRIAWEGTCDLTADDILIQQDRNQRGVIGDTAASAVDRAVTWLMARFERTPTVPVSEIKKEAVLEGIAWRNVEKAKSRLRIRSSRIGGTASNGHWVWAAPSVPAAAAESEDEDRKTAEKISFAALEESEPAAARNSAQNGAFAKTAKAALANPAGVDAAALAVDPDDVPPGTDGERP